MPKISSALPRRSRWRALMLTGAVALGISAYALLGTASAKPASQTTFKLWANKPFLSCAQAQGKHAKVSATVTSGNLNDSMTLSLSGFKPNLAFSLFTIQKSNQLANGDPDPNFTNFGLAWYQSDMQVGANGTGTVTIHTILLNQIFGFDPAVSLAPTNTFHVGFWFDDPADAAACGFTGTTPFNGEHNAGPNAFITRPDAVNDLGPLCTTPAGPGVCNP
ncbi:MAG: hypothetical protein M3O94_06370 [Actinomycetota bacterium]|nr:hypothetical protein [Actinomycetota bacterium]